MAGSWERPGGSTDTTNVCVAWAERGGSGAAGWEAASPQCGPRGWAACWRPLLSVPAGHQRENEGRGAVRSLCPGLPWLLGGGGRQMSWTHPEAGQDQGLRKVPQPDGLPSVRPCPTVRPR